MPPPLSVAMRIAPPPAAAGLRSFQNGAMHVVWPSRVREHLRSKVDVRARAAADHDVAIGDDAHPRVRLTTVEERRHVEVA